MIRLKNIVRLEPVFKLRVVYKSGYTHDFEATKFKIVPGREAEWTPARHHNKPIHFGIDDVAAVWQLGHRTRLRFGRG